MAIDLKVGARRSCTLYTRHEYRGNTSSDDVRTGRQFITSASAWEFTRDASQLARLATLMRHAQGGAYASGPAPEQLVRALQCAVESGDVIAVVPKPRASGARSSPIEQTVRPYYATVTPSQLFRRALAAVPAARSFERPILPRLAADDGLAIWYARPGDVLPDGTIATPVSTPLGDAQPFEYSPNQVDEGSFDVAKTPNLGDPGTWYTNPGSGQMRLYGDDRKPVVDLDFDHVHNGLKPHAHNWDNGVRDGGDYVVPFSPWSP
ncbi:hypothetical protein [Paraburkholderia sp. MM6662-R1]|uniref:hypothetical protein n=1 Tax=Paraburkholderia sp. MM6662-R1 TaxID=2991066 RepID=UPI003D2041D8